MNMNVFHILAAVFNIANQKIEFSWILMIFWYVKVLWGWALIWIDDGRSGTGSWNKSSSGCNWWLDTVHIPGSRGRAQRWLIFVVALLVPIPHPRFCGRRGRAASPTSASRRRSPIGGYRPWGAALITRPYTPELRQSTALASKALYRISRDTGIPT